MNKTTNENKKDKTMNKINKSTIETVKTVLISVLVTGILAFVGGMHYANAQHAKTTQAVQAAVSAKHDLAKK